MPEHLLPKEALEGFHPSIAEWFRNRFDAPSGPQRLGWPAIRSGGDALIAAPTGSGKTLAAFLWCLDSLIRQGIDGALSDQTQVVYVSPLKALSNDVQKNLSRPLEEIGAILERQGLPSPEIRVLVRTGDTTSSQRQAMSRKPPHILVTTPESLYILLTSEKGRGMLRSVRTVIVDEIHSVASSKRGSHLSLTLERLDVLVSRDDAPLDDGPTRDRPQRIGLSATQKPIEDIARFLVGIKASCGQSPLSLGEGQEEGNPDCQIIDEGYTRNMDIALEIPGSPLAAVCSAETWEEIYDRLAELITERRTTLVFVNTRRLAERVAFNLGKRLGEDVVGTHHGSLSKERRLKVEQRLKAGELKALVATASLELGIDIGDVDLACQLSTTRSIATLLQRVGRSGHTLSATPVGRLFPLTRDDLVECAAILHRVRNRHLDRIIIPEKPLDILAQQIIAATAAEGWSEDDLFALCKRSYAYRNLTREEFDEVCQMLTEGFTTKRGRSGAYLHHDAVGKRFRARKGARLAAVTSGGAIPDTADYDVVLEPQNVIVGTVNEDFAVESIPGNIFQLGTSSWRILKIEQGKVRVEDAHGQPPTIPFWLGEAPPRTDEVSEAVSWLREEISRRLRDEPSGARMALDWAVEHIGVGKPAAEQLVEYVAAGKQALGVVPTQRTIVLERFFDESGGMQLVVHAPFGSRINRAWGLALRKKFCRTFNFELQAAASDDAIVLSLGMQHSFPLEDVFHYLQPATARYTLEQAMLPAPMFQTRWRWNVSRSLAVLRFHGGKKVPMPLQRMRAEDLLASAFPTVLACPENVVGDVEVPDHPLVKQTVDDCLYEAMDIDGFTRLIGDVTGGKLNLVARDTTEPSPFAHEVLTARPYTYLDDAPLEERRTQAVHMRRTLDLEAIESVGQLDPEAIRRVREQAWPSVEDADELHDALMLTGYLTEVEGEPWFQYYGELAEAKRALQLRVGGDRSIWIAAEHLPMLRAVHPQAEAVPSVEVPKRFQREWQYEDAMREILRGRLETLGPVTADGLAESLGVGERDIEAGLVALETEGFALRGRFTPGAAETEWCDRRLLARIHRYTLDKLRQEIEPVSAADFMRFLMAWHHVDPENRLDGPMGLVGVLEVLEGFGIPLGAWEEHILPSRIIYYRPDWLDQLCLSGEVAWARLHPPSDNGDGRRGGVTRSSPISFVFRENLDAYLSLAAHHEPAVRQAHRERGQDQTLDSRISGVARQIMDVLERKGACFFQDLANGTRQLPVQVEEGLRELVFLGLVTSDGYTGLRALASQSRNRPSHQRRSRREHRNGLVLSQRMPSGRWSLLRRPDPQAVDDYERTEILARQLLRRYGVVFHRLLARENDLPPWRDLIRTYRRLEARGEIRGGRFVSGFSGEQYALPEAVQSLRAVRKKRPDDRLITVNATDPLNLVGIATPGQRVQAIASNQVSYKNGVPYSVKIGHQTTYLQTERPKTAYALNSPSRP